MDKEGICTGKHVCQTEGDGEVCFIYLRQNIWNLEKDNKPHGWLPMTYRLRILKEKLKKQRQHLDELDAHMYVPCSVVAMPPYSVHIHLSASCKPCFTDTFVIAMLSLKNKVASTISNISCSSKAWSSLLHSLKFSISVHARNLLLYKCAYYMS